MKRVVQHHQQANIHANAKTDLKASRRANGKPKVKASGKAQYISYAQSILNIIGAAFALDIWGSLVPAYPFRTWAEVTMLSGIITILALFIFQKRWTSLVGSIFFIFNIIPIYGLIWFANAGMASLGVVWVPFEACRLSSLTVAILAPTKLWVGILCIAGFMGSAFLQYQSFPPETLKWIPHGELLSTFVYGVFSLVLLFYRFGSRARERRKVRSVEQATMMKRLATIILALRDLANTPVQTLTVDAALLRKNHPGAEFLAGRIELSAAKLKKLNSLLVTETSAINGGSGNVAFDSKDIVSRLESDRPNPLLGL